MKFGIVKSKIETHLLESYKKGEFKNEIQKFKTFVLNDKNISKIFHLYDELSTNKGLNESEGNDYIFECIRIYENLVNKIEPKKLNSLNNWVLNIQSENKYSDIDILFSTDISTLQNKLSSKKNIVENLKRKPQETKNSINIPLTSMVSIANKSINEFVNSMDDKNKKDLFEVISKKDDELLKDFSDIKESVLNKLNEMKTNQHDEDTLSKIQETIDKVVSEEYDKVKYLRLKNLNESI